MKTYEIYQANDGTSLIVNVDGIGIAVIVDKTIESVRDVYSFVTKAVYARRDNPDRLFWTMNQLNYSYKKYRTLQLKKESAK